MPLLHSKLTDMLRDLNLNIVILKKPIVNSEFTNKKAPPLGTTIHCEPGKHPEWIISTRPRGKRNEHRS